jgi:DNA/RNA-binding domain of Phe-tRNA-synthetase-like protein
MLALEACGPIIVAGVRPDLGKTEDRQAMDNDHEPQRAFTVAPECQQLGLRAWAIEFRNLRVGPASAELRAAIAREAAAIQARFTSPADIRTAPEFVPFHVIFRAVGANPRRDQTSIERLLAFAFKRGDLPAINGLVDAYNLVSLRTGLSLGAHDLDRIALPVALRLLTGTEPFVPLGSPAPEPVTAGEFGYVDGAGRVLCRLDVRQAEFSKVTAQTRNALLIIEGATSHAAALFEQALADVVALMTRHCGGNAAVVARP